MLPKKRLRTKAVWYLLIVRYRAVISVSCGFVGRLMRRGVPAFCLGVCLSLPASGATLNAVKGQVLVSQGDGFHRVVSATNVREGDLVMANPGGSAKLVYPGGCVVEIKPETVVAVNDGSKCNRPLLLGNDCESSSDPNVQNRCRCRRDDDLSDDKDLRPLCGFVWWPVAVGAAIPVAGFLISTANDPGQQTGQHP
jgi:hypothetical protein